jgi:hypothetical protein
MMIFMITLGFFIVVVVGMSVGYIFQQKSLAGSCGGLSSVGIDKSCNCDNPCDKRKERERLAATKENMIDIKNI